MHEKTKQLKKELAVRKEEETRKQAARDERQSEAKDVKEVEEVKEVKEKKVEAAPKATVESTEEKAKIEIAA